MTPLCRAAQKGNDKIVEMLVDAGVDVNAVSKVGVIFPVCMCAVHVD